MPAVLVVRFICPVVGFSESPAGVAENAPPVFVMVGVVLAAVVQKLGAEYAKVANGCAMIVISVEVLAL